MKAHIISIGDEILIGQTINTNAAYIGSKLVENNVQVIKTSVIGDDYEQIIKGFKLAYDESDLVIVTGGLGPTHDDITRKCIVDFFDTELVHNDTVLEDIKNLGILILWNTNTIIFYTNNPESGCIFPGNLNNWWHIRKVKSQGIG